MLGVVKFYRCNYQSVCNILDSQAIDFKIIDAENERDFSSCKGFILPGVGNAENCLRKFYETKNGSKLLNKLKLGNTYLLGICVGAQILLSESSESDDRKGLNVISGRTQQLYADGKVEVGFKGIENIDHSMFENIPQDSLFYFSHGYIANITDKDVSVSRTICKNKYPAFFFKNKVFCVQFHPERSGRVGGIFFKNFASIVKSYS
ncbi:imidazole glycerol phosphate synthase subunit HisH [Paracoccaceae bacterium]|nr:imidazole glycerol phosphate synthase subunit HisH [Paracoccaceae bacterium]